MGTASVGLSSSLNNHELDKFVQQATELLKLTAVQAMNASANPNIYRARPSELKVGQRTYPSVAKVVTDRFQQLDPQVKRVVGLDLGRNRDITHQLRRVAVDIRAERTVFEQVDVQRHFQFVNGTTFSESSMRKMVADLGTAVGGSASAAASAAARDELRAWHDRFRDVIPVRHIEGIFAEIDASATSGSSGTGSSGGQVVTNRGLNFRVHEAKCIDETDPEWAGSDEISWGGAAVDDTGDTTKLPEFFVGSGFDDGDSKRYSPPKIVHSFDMSSGQYPKTYMVTLALAEKDSGGMSAFIEELYQAIKAHVVIILGALGAAAGAAIGAAIGGTVGTTVGGPLGTIIGIVAGAILGALVAWLVTVLKDDIFPPEASSAFFGSASDTFAGGGLISPQMYLHYRDHGGHYRLTYDWQIVR